MRRYEAWHVARGARCVAPCNLQPSTCNLLAMRRFSQRNSLVTLSDINITPLLDLAFVLLIIFVITTPLLEQGMNLNLPVGGQADSRKLEKQDIRTVEVGTQGLYMLNRRWMRLDEILSQLRAEHRVRPKLVVDIRGDENTPYKHVAAIFDGLTRAGIEQVSLRTKPPPR
jgi:biopolymer transport protein ExbD